MIRQSYVTAGSNPVDQLLFFVLSESRLAVFEHHLDEKPRYQTRIYSNHLTSVQYLTQVGNVLNIQVEKVYGYDEWLQALDQGIYENFFETNLQKATRGKRLKILKIIFSLAQRAS